MKETKTIIGVDPGTTIMGYGFISVKGQDVTLLSLGVIDLHKLDNHFEKLQRIWDRISGMIQEYKPDEMAIEAPFFGKNVQSMLKLGRAQGVAISAALSHNIPVFEYAPRKIKMSITGYGNASKEQVAAMMQKLLKFENMPKYLDATDGLAAAMCHHFQSSAPKSVSSVKSWKEFISKNPGRVK
jgi:crossover junction endodeoxyribonuclease RuvC